MQTINRIPQCAGCPLATYISPLPRRRYEPPEPGGFVCGVTEEFIVEGQEPSEGECKYLAGYASAPPHPLDVALARRDWAGAARLGRRGEVVDGERAGRGVEAGTAWNVSKVHLRLERAPPASRWARGELAKLSEKEKRTMTKSKVEKNLQNDLPMQIEAIPVAEPETSSSPPSVQDVPPQEAGLYQKMALVMGKLERLPKSGWNSFHKYHYVTDADVMDVLRVNLAEAGVAFLPNIVNVVRDTNRVTVEIALTLTDADTGEMITATWFGEANDRKGTDDKAIQKAVTAAVKYFLLKTFLISTGDEAQDTDSGAGDARQAKLPSSPPPKPPPTRAELEERWKDLWQQALGLDLDPDELPTISPDGTDAELIATGKKLAAIVEAAKPEKKAWNARSIAAVLEAELSENSYSVIGALKKSDLSPDTPADVVVAWFRQYRASRDAEGSSDEAATIANAWLAGEVD